MFGLHIVRYACGGISLHTKVRHQIMDGNGVWRFYSVWAKMCYDANTRPHAQAASKAGETPVHDRLVVQTSLGSSTSSSGMEARIAKDKRLDLERFFAQLVAHQQQNNGSVGLEGAWG
ncbi:hypothetical protein LPJ75_004863, partial [Coemansia sp. RSA 2598]